jgi:hypothetical protein
MYTNINYTYPTPEHPYNTNIKVETTTKLLDINIYPLKEKFILVKHMANNYTVPPSFLYKIPFSTIKYDNIVNFLFNDISGFSIYKICYKIITNDKNKCLIISNNYNIFASIYYLYTYVLYLKSKITIYYISDKSSIELQSYCKKNDIKCDKLDIQNTSLLDIIIIDYLPAIEPLLLFRNIFQLCAINNLIIYALKKLNKNGTLIIVSTLFTNIINYQYYYYLSYFFKKVKINRSILNNTGSFNNPIYITCHNYKGNIDLQPLLMLEDTILKYNPNRHRDIKISDKEEIQLLQTNGINVPETLINDGTYMHITNFMDVDPKLYKKFKVFQQKNLNTCIYNVTQLQIQIQENKLDYIIEQTRLEAILIAKKYKLPLKEWVYISSDIYNNQIANEFEKLVINQNFLITHTNKINIAKHTKISIRKYKYIKQIINRTIFSYNYVDQYDKDKFQSIELWFNNRFKKLNTYLHQRDISINGHKVSRGWTKMYEMLSDIKLLEKCTKDNKINIFHTCEAPGNFINAISHYIKTHMPDIEHIWKAQSLKEGLHDHYGFMEKTNELWDYGLDNSGDIVNNFSYYYDKYINCDMYISDCGQHWTNEKTKLGLIQLIYALLLPRVGGGFVIKIQNCAYLDKIEISLVYIITNKYKHIHICRSNMNFWSSEIYIVGYDKQEITETEKETILNCINMSDYPVEKIKSKFVISYCDIINKYISQAIRFRTYFLFLSENKKIFNTNKKQYENIIDKYIRLWIDKYII